MKTVIVLGGSGFIGSECVRALVAAGWEPKILPAPRLLAVGRSLTTLAAEALAKDVVIEHLKGCFASFDAVVNAAGRATPSASACDELYGANALLPGVISIAAQQAGVQRYVHVGSAAVQGRMEPLDESGNHQPFSPYSESKAFGEQLVTRYGGEQSVTLRPTSVHGRTRQVTKSLVRISGSPLSSTAGPGDRPTPQVLVQNVGAAVAFLVNWPGETDLPKVVLQPNEGLTTGGLLALLGQRSPWHLPWPLAHVIERMLPRVTRGSSFGEAVARRLGMLWFGQDQVSGWLTDEGFYPPFGREHWEMMMREVRVQRPADRFFPHLARLERRLCGRAWRE